MEERFRLAKTAPAFRLTLASVAQMRRQQCPVQCPLPLPQSVRSAFRTPHTAGPVGPPEHSPASRTSSRRRRTPAEPRGSSRQALPTPTAAAPPDSVTASKGGSHGHERHSQRQADNPAPRRRGTADTEAGGLRVPARAGVLRRRGDRPDPARQLDRAHHRSADPPHQRRPVHLRHRLDHPVRRVLEGRRPAAAAAGRHVHRGVADDRHRPRQRRRDRGPAGHLRRSDRRRTVHLPHRALLLQADPVLPAGRDGHGDHHHRHRAAARRRGRRSRRCRSRHSTRPAAGTWPTRSGRSPSS